MFDATFLVDAARTGEQSESAISDDNEVAIAAVTVAELGVGVELSVGKTRRARQAFIDEVLATIPVR